MKNSKSKFEALVTKVEASLDGEELPTLLAGKRTPTEPYTWLSQWKRVWVVSHPEKGHHVNTDEDIADHMVEELGEGASKVGPFVLETDADLEEQSCMVQALCDVIDLNACTPKDDSLRSRTFARAANIAEAALRPIPAERKI